ncbi:hypothetical protein [Dactylosporangium sp. NPDC000521]|uniref:DUF6197 family protein n=1 Tax=Dactylosporangium sp. NPDC000521 TaxID=3363975 RepID=UPI00369D5217
MTSQRVPGTPATADTTGAADAVRDVLLAAAKYLSEHGWNQHELYDSEHAVNPAACTVGALSMVCYGYPAEVPASNVTHPGFEDFDAALFRLDCYIAETFGPEMGGVLGFNDMPGHTAADVLAMLRDAALWVPGPAWANVPRCGCGDRMLLNTEVPYCKTGDEWFGDLYVGRFFTCRTCGKTELVEATDPDDRTVVVAGFREWVLQRPHEGDPHVAGTCDDCDVCGRYCFCTADVTCVLHSESDDTCSDWFAPGQPSFGTAAGAALGGAE